MAEKKSVYVASPLGFSECGRFFMYEKIFPMIEGLGFEIIDPWKLTPQSMIDQVTEITDRTARTAAWRELNIVIGDNNRKGIERSDGIFAILDGTDVDSGTASEIGYGAALGKPVTAYRGDFRISGDNEGSMVNLQVEYFIFSSGGRIAAALDEAERDLKSLFISSAPSP